MKQFFIDAVFGMIIGLKFVSITYFLYLGMQYISDRSDSNDISLKAWRLLFVPVIIGLLGYRDMTEKTFAIVFLIAGMIALCALALTDYNRKTR